MIGPVPTLATVTTSLSRQRAAFPTAARRGLRRLHGWARRALRYHPAVTLRHRVFLQLEGDQPGSRATRYLRSAICTLILLNVAAVVLETVPSVHAAAPHLFAGFEVFSIAVFSVEYLLRLWAAPEDPRYLSPTGRLRWMLSPAAIVDLTAVLPGLLAAVDLRPVRLLRLLRIVRVARLGRYSVAVQTLCNVLRAKAADLLSLLFMLLGLLVVSSTLMFFLEHDAQPQAFASIPAVMWWGIVTLTTVGYGDMTPVTAAGRVLGGVTAILGIGAFALLAGLLGAAFVDELARAREAKDYRAAVGAEGQGPTCPHCGKPMG